jgi:hypothetical protein
MKNIGSLYCLLCFFFCCRITFQQTDSCSELLKQGIYDYYSETTSTSDYSEFKNDFCSEYSYYSENYADRDFSSYYYEEYCTTETSTMKGKAKGAFGNVISGSGKYSSTTIEEMCQENLESSTESTSAEEIKNIGDSLCHSEFGIEQATALLEKSSQLINTKAIEAYNECLEISQAGLKVSTTVSDDQERVTIQMHYVPHIGGLSETSVSDIVIQPKDSWECKGALWDLVQGQSDGIVGTENVAMSCQRKMSEYSFNYHGQSLYAKASSITVDTISGSVTSR